MTNSIGNKVHNSEFPANGNNDDPQRQKSSWALAVTVELVVEVSWISTEQGSSASETHRATDAKLQIVSYQCSADI
jgi:hypothetical protein